MTDASTQQQPTRGTPPSALRLMLPGPREVVVEPFELESPGRGEVLIQTEASAVSPGTELAIYTGVHQWLADPNRSWPVFPFVPGYSAVGRIVEVGAGVEGYAGGERVIWAGRHASHEVVDVAAAGATLRPVADHVPAPVAATAVQARFPLAALAQSGSQLGQSVAVLGLGLIGQLTLRLFSATGAYPLYALDPIAFRRQTAAATPGVTALDPSEGDVGEALRSLNRGESPDVVVDATGAPDAVKLAMTVVADGGKVIMVGSPRGIAGEVDFYRDLHGRSISLIGAHGTAIGAEPREKFPFTRERAMRLLVHLLESGKLQADDLITHHVPARDLGAMYEGLLNRREEFLGVALHW